MIILATDKHPSMLLSYAGQADETQSKTVPYEN